MVALVAIPFAYSKFLYFLTFLPFLEQALSHPWIEKNESNSGDSLAAASKALKDFSAAAQLKKTIAALLVKEQSDEETAKLRKLFDELDVDGDGVLDLAELPESMLHHGHEPRADAEAAARAYLAAADEAKVC